MKKIHILTLALIIIYSNSFCQLEKKTWLIGGSGNYKSSKTNVNERTNIAVINANIGYFLKDKFVVGLKPGFYHESIKSTSQKYIYNFYQIGPFVRYYFLKKDARLNVFSDLSYQFGVRNINDANGGRANRFQSNAGCVLFFNNSVALEFSVGYSNNTFKRIGRLDLFQSNIGFQFHLTK